jgi:DNA helicase-2/ATP-dependent DNA helicase PcrA
MAAKLRPAQSEILKYTGGQMAISAVPGSGKTFTLAVLAAQLIADGRIDPSADQQILVVTYLNASVDSFRASIRRRLDELELPPIGFDVRTLHSLALEIVNLSTSGLDVGGNDPVVLDETQSNGTLALAVDNYIESYPDVWRAFLPDDSPQMRARWRNITQQTAQTFIRTAKNGRYHPNAILNRLESNSGHKEAADDGLQSSIGQSPLLWMMAGIYGRYHTILARQAALDFDDLIWQAADLLEQRSDLADELRLRWPYVLEDEAQDSVPLQEILIGTLMGKEGNWVRVGDPNQAITSTFTAAHPRFFRQYIDYAHVVSLPLPNSGRCASLIYGAANALVDWVIDKHPVPEVREHTFRRQHIQPTPPGDAQPNPADSEAHIRIKVYRHREDEELPAIANLAARYAQERPEHTLAILVPTNQVGHELAQHLDELDADYDNLLRGGGRVREIASAMYAVLALMADPLSSKALAEAYASLNEMQHPAASESTEDLEHFLTVLRSVHRPESVLFPWNEEDLVAALPAGVASEEDVRQIEHFGAFLRRLFGLRSLPIDDLALAVGDELFALGESGEADLATAYQIAALMRRWRITQPDWRLPELVAQLSDIARGRQSIPFGRPSDLGYEPQKGRITLATQHGAKGLEWDAVFLMGIDGFWIPAGLQGPFLGAHDFLGGDPTAEVNAQLRYLMEGHAGLFPGRDATESAHIEVICERLRLLYVGITRARRFLHISRSRATRRYNKDRESEPATVLGVLYGYVNQARV